MLIKVLSLYHDVFTLLDAAQVGRILSPLTYVRIFCTFQSSYQFPLTRNESQLLFPFCFMLNQGNFRVTPLK